MEKAEYTPLLWMFVGQTIMIGGALMGQAFLGFIGIVAAFIGLFTQVFIARILAQPYSFIKAPIRSFFYQSTIVLQVLFKHMATNHSDKILHYYKNLSIFQLEKPYTHPAYGKQNFLTVEHDGEYTDHVNYETGEVTYAGVGGVPHNKVDINDFWETPFTHSVGAEIIPIYIFSKGGAKKDYDKWIDEQWAKMESPARAKLAKVMEGLGL